MTFMWGQMIFNDNSFLSISFFLWINHSLLRIAKNSEFLFAVAERLSDCGLCSIREYEDIKNSSSSIFLCVCLCVKATRRCVTIFRFPSLKKVGICLIPKCCRRDVYRPFLKHATVIDILKHAIEKIPKFSSLPLCCLAALYTDFVYLFGRVTSLSVY